MLNSINNSGIQRKEVNKKIAVVTGVSGAIGMAIAQALLQAGCFVVGTYNRASEEKVTVIREQLLAIGESFELMAVDISDFEACQRFSDTVVTNIGIPSILVNNAGITSDSAFKKMSKDAWDSVVNVNLNGVFNVTKMFFEGMCEQQYGRIINISSINAQNGQFGQCNYSATKAGIHGFTKSLALEGARRNVTVNSISPGYIDTAMLASIKPHILQSIIEAIPVGRLGKPEDVARSVLFLAAQEAPFITGSDLMVNGGQYLN
jgi:acetoacetyl-CoA reductase